MLITTTIKMTETMMINNKAMLLRRLNFTTRIQQLSEMVEVKIEIPNNRNLKYSNAFNKHLCHPTNTSCSEQCRI